MLISSRYKTKAISERSALIKDLANAKLDIVIKVIDFVLNDKNKVYSSSKVVFKLLQLETKFIWIATSSIHKINNNFINTYEVAD